MDWRNIAAIPRRGGGPIRAIRLIGAFGIVCLLAACRTPFSDKLTSIDWNGPPAVGTIAISQPKMYRRESLIDEQREDVAWLKDLLKKSESATFAPEIARETEQITTFAAALGLSFDPAGATGYWRDAETGQLQHEIDVVKLQLQLDQLKRDAELVREKLPAQTEPANNPASPPAPAAGTSTPAAPASAAPIEKPLEQLHAAIERLTTQLAAQLGKMGGRTGVALAVNPSDLLRDRLAHRDLIKAALASANLDDLHDHGGSALVRLDFQAMALPDREHSRVPGVIQMQIQRPALSDDEWKILYRGWLDHVNQKINRATASGWEPDPELASLAHAGMFTLATYYYPRVPVAAASKGAPQRSSMCKGVARAHPALDEECGKLVVAVPQFKGFSVQEGAFSTFDAYFHLLVPPSADGNTDATALHQLILRMGPAAVRNCGLPERPPVAARSDASDLYEGIAESHMLAAAGEELQRIDGVARKLLDAGHTLPRMAASDPIRQRIERARFILNTFEQAVYARCPAERRAAFWRSAPQPYLPPEFKALVAREPRVAVYEVGPREQVQQVSSAARVANSLSLAFSLAAAAPGAGRNANAAANYARQALGRAETFERVPALIGFAVDSERFGWVITPKAVFEARGELALEQVARALDLSVSLSIPGWWPRVTIHLKTGWGLDAASISSGNMPMPARQPIEVPMTQNYADYEAMTARIQRGAGPGILRTELDQDILKGQAVAACHPTSLYIRGSNIWRATAVAIGSHRLDAADIKVAPDMSGVLLAVPALGDHMASQDAPGEAIAKLPFSVFTRYGQVSGTVAFRAAPHPGCAASDKPRHAPAAPSSTAGAPKPAP